MKILLLVIIVIVVALVIVYTYFGGFKSLEFKVTETGGETLIYKDIKGEYKQVGKIGDEIYYDLLNNYKIETYKGYSIYYDNPKTTEKINLRSEAGSIIEEGDMKRVDELTDKYKTKVYPKKKYITTEFPFKGKMSVFISIMKVLPALNKYANENGYDVNTPVMEIYDVPNKKIFYRKEISKK